jgi:ribosomal protein S18 acetylase RimI-like enzyme
MKIFKLTIGDVEKYSLDIKKMLRQSFEKSFPEEIFELVSFETRVDTLKNYIEKEKAIVFGCKLNENFTGFVWFFEKEILEKKIIHINHFVVHENFRRLGIGKALWDEVEKYATIKGIENMELLVTEKNYEAVDFYSKRNFQIERLVMKKRLTL